MIVSTTKPAPSAASSTTRVGLMRAKIFGAASEPTKPRSTKVARLAEITDRARSRVVEVRDHRATSKPEEAKTWAKPGPIVPAPKIPTFLMSPGCT